MSVNKDFIVIHENLVEYDLQEDFFNICKKTRESYMFLRELKDIYFNSLQVENKANLDHHIRRKFKRETLSLLDEFEQLDSKIINPKNTLKFKDGKMIIDKLSDDKEQDLKEIILQLKNFIELREKIDELQLNILTHMCEQYIIILKGLSDRNDDFELDYLIKINDISMRLHFDIHTDLDRIDTIKLDLNRRSKMWKGLNEEEKNLLPCYLKVTNYDYMLNKRRELFKEYSKAMIESLKLKAIYAEKEELKKYNNNIRLLTILNIIIALIGIFR